MKKHLLFLILTLFIVGLAMDDVEAQTKRRRRRPTRRGGKMPKRSKYFSVGGGIGYNNYFGDLAPASGLGSTSFNGANLYIGATGEYRFHPNFSVRAGMALSGISASDAKADPAKDANSLGRYQRNLSFRNDMIEASGMITANLFPVNRGFLKRAPINPYAFIGINLFTNNPKAREYGKGSTGKYIALHDLNTEGQGLGGGTAYKTIQLGMPLGVGVKFYITRKIDVSFELGYRFTFTNYLDDVGGSYLDPSTYAAADPTTVRMSNRTGEIVDVYGNARKIGGVEVKSLLEGSNYAKATLKDGSTFYYQKGTEKGQAPRGGPSPDYWLTSAFHIHYILGSSRGGPRRRR